MGEQRDKQDVADYGRIERRNELDVHDVRAEQLPGWKSGFVKFNREWYLESDVYSYGIFRRGFYSYKK